jgi:hypothetical protein
MVEKGIGVVSIRTIPKGTLLLQETPLIIQDEGATGDTIKEALDAIDRDKQREFLALTNSHRGQMNTLLGIFRVSRSVTLPLLRYEYSAKTNALPCTTPSYVTPSKKLRRYGIFPEAARFNSSCSPNVSFVWHKKLGVLRLYSLRDIIKGEELCVAYELPLLGSRAERWNASESIYGFRCECTACATVGKSVLDSDKNRKELKMRQRASKFIFTDPVGGLRMVRSL